MKKIITLALLLVVALTAFSQEKEPAVRYIEVSGKAELEIDPDEFILVIGIEEYWKEEFQKRADEKDFRTKVPISQIENELIKAIEKAGISKEHIAVRGMGNFWRQRGKDFLISKQLEVTLSDFSKVNELAKLADTKGFKNMYISEMRNTQIDAYEKEVRIKALQNAREKAAYLLQSIGEQPGPVLSVSETMENRYVMPMNNGMMMRSVQMESMAEEQSVDQLKKIKLSYQINARFGIK